ncbi:MAG: hypothetical protein IPH63_05465 [Flavobacteriales bacterium]|nr:hypothetical protein [Flavobacteriales bacterium]
MLRMIPFGLSSGIKDYGLKVDFSQYPHVRHELKYGLQYTYHIYTPSTVDVESGDTEFAIDTPSKLNAHEGALYFQDDYSVNRFGESRSASLLFCTCRHFPRVRAGWEWQQRWHEGICPRQEDQGLRRVGATDLHVAVVDRTAV